MDYHKEKLMDKTLNRKDEIYQSIESFEEYEFTQCIAYEMAIRNTEIAKLLFEQHTLPYIEDKTHTETYEPPQKDLIHQKLLEKYFIGTEILLDYSKRLHVSSLFNTSLNHIKLYAQDKTQSIAKLASMYQFKDVHELFRAAKLEKEYFTDCTYSLLKSHKLFNNSFYSNESQITYRYDSGLVYVAPLDEKERQDTMIFSPPEGYIEKVFDFKIDISLKRPKFEIHKESKPTINLELNLALPKDELIAFITKIKNDYDNDKTLPITPMNLLGDDILNTEKIALKQKKSKSQKIADWFFIYDYYKLIKPYSNKSDEIIFGEIDLKLMEHYESDKDYYSNETYKKTIMPKMKYFIENLGYKELLTGSFIDG